MLNEVLQNHKPDTWDNGSYYTSQRYRKVQVFGEEYNKVLETFSADLKSRVQSIFRVQNPYLYGRYKLRTEQLQLHETVYEQTMYHPIAEDDMTTVMEYNCDYRRYTNATVSQYSSKKPTFYKTPEAADNAYYHPNKALVVLKVASTSVYSYSQCQKDWDTDYYPEYIVAFT